MGNHDCATYLRTYLNKYLPFQGRLYDQTWVLGTLAQIERVSPAEFLDPVLWTEGYNAIDPMSEIRRFSDTIAFVKNNQMCLTQRAL